MGMQPETKYDAQVIDAFMTESKTKGTAGLFFALQTEVGRVEHTAWITPNTVSRLKEVLYDCFGVTSEQLSDLNFLAKIGEKLKGQMVSITRDEGDEQYGVKVKWMNPAGFTPKRVEPVGLKRIAGLFGGGPVSSPAYMPRAEEPPPASWDGSDVPF